MMGVSRSGYYKWTNHSTTHQELSRAEMIEVVLQVHQQHPSHGYRWVAAYIRHNLGRSICDSYAYKCWRYLDLQSKTKHKHRRRYRKPQNKYPNLIFSTWECVDRPRQVIVSDMTVIKCGSCYFELTLYFDVYTKELLTWQISDRRGDRAPYIRGLKDVIMLLQTSKEPAILHTDQGTVYASIAYNSLIQDTNIKRSMSRPGKPTDNPVNESLNGWIKEELFFDFHIERCCSVNDIKDVLRKYTIYYNNQRPCYSLGYMTPIDYYNHYMSEENHQQTFEQREISPIPKFVRKKKERAKDDDDEMFLAYLSFH